MQWARVLLDSVIFQPRQVTDLGLQKWVIPQFAHVFSELHADLELHHLC